MKAWHIYTVEDYKAVNKNEITKFLGKYIELWAIILCEVTQTQKTNVSFLLCVGVGFEFSDICVLFWTPIQVMKLIGPFGTGYFKGGERV